MYSAFRFLIAVPFVVSVLNGRAGDWPQWRGPERSGHALNEAPLPASLPPTPKLDWRIEIGGGFSSPVVAAGKVAFLDGQAGKEVVHLLNASTGKELWHVPFADLYQDEWGPGPRSTPIIDGDRLYVQSCKGEFRCLALADGKELWRTSFEKDFGVTFFGSKGEEGTASRRGNNGCGVIDGTRIYLQVGSAKDASLVAFDKQTGKLLWKSEKDEAAYSSLMMANVCGARQVIYFSADALMGLEAAGGKLLWRVPLKTFAKRHASTPIIYGDSVIVNSHTFGLMRLKITKSDDKFQAAQVWVNRDMKINIATPVMVDHYLFSQGPGQDLVCVDAEDGKLKWSHGGFGEKYGTVIAVDKRLLVLSDRGQLVMLAADGEKYSELGRAQVCGKTWNHPAYSEAKLYVREGLTSGWKLSCFDLIH
jgi:outer membrane protein assembly factor BamB